jgi:hypothetical protein
MTPILQRDPGTCVLVFAAWAALNGLSLVLLGAAFSRSVAYAEVARLDAADAWWWLGKLANPALRGIIVRWVRVGWRALVAVLSAPPWFAVGPLMMGGTASASSLSAAGAFGVISAVYLGAAGAQWAYTLVLASPHPALAAGAAEAALEEG